jgi:surface antigen
MAIRDLLKKIPGVAPFVNAYNIAEATVPMVRNLITPTAPTYTSPSAVSGFSAQASAGGGGGGGTSAPITKTKEVVAAQRKLKPEEINNLNAAYKRIQSGMGSTADKANVDYAKNKGMWTPPTSTVRDISGGSIAPPYTPPGQVNIALETNNSNTRAPLGAGNPAPVQPQKPVDTAASWQKAMTDLLRGAQGQGLDTDLLGQRNALIQARFGAQTAMTPEQLRVLSPGAQAGLRGQDVSGLESQLSGVQTALQGREKERSELRQVMEKAQDRLAALESEERGYAYDTAKEQRAAEAKMDEPLSYEEAAALGVAYGPTRREAAAMGIVPTTGGGEPITKTVDGKLLQYDPTTGDWSDVSTGAMGGIPIEVSQENQTSIDLVNNILSDPNLKDITGFGGTWAGKPLASLSAENRNAVAKFDQIKNMVSLEGRKKLKGSGTISDFEAKMLADAETSLRRNLSDDEARRVLTNIKTAFEVGALGPLADQFGVPRSEIRKLVEDPEVGYELTKQYLQGFKPAPNTALKGSIAAKFPQGTTGGQCTTWLHKVAEFPHIGDGKNDKIRSVQKYGFTFNEQPPKVGDIIVTNENKTYGHTAMIIAMSPNGVATLAESNFAAPEKVTYTRKIDLRSPKIYGAIRPTKIKTLA